MPSISETGDWTLSFTATVPLATTADLSLQHPDGGATVPLNPLELHAGTGRYSITIPASAPRAPLTSLWLDFNESRPGQPFTDTLLVESAALAVGDFAHIYWNGRDLGGTETGYYAALFADGTLLSARHFDTFNDPAASNALAAYLDGAPGGSLLALAGSDAVSAGDGTAGLRLGDNVWQALRGFGASDRSDMRGKYGWSHAFIGVKGAAVASEDSSDIRPARLFMGAPVRTAAAYAGFEGFHLTASAVRQVRPN
jgi:hypothetical protein